MQLFRVSNLIMVGVFMFSFMPGDKEVEGGHLSLLLLLPALLLKIGLAAPIVLAVLAKLLLLLGLKKKAVVLPALLLGGSSDSTTASYGSKSTIASYGSKSTETKNSYGRIKRSVDFVQGVVGKVDITEEELLETILNLDTRRCGQKILCEVAAQTAQTPDIIDEDELALMSLFGDDDTTTYSGTAQNIFREAMQSGYKLQDCASRYPSCPYGRKEMMQWVHLITDPEHA